ncbi:DUF6114 domain-containing protein [Streptomyces poonensis]|uniref:Integral membrane protein n=1 Tax=Streptomyces poonensis TaxID=68255 RepID=A0A918P7H0_9ACTN|nr:DUF6114 domain-containing protein [Streptomyces poonensis]GGY87861.1 hypothetical protein GCM10010365_02350 [Streptomyces poonensis]GLJ90275.1 hypothetical protein GCM10017589_28780 [Streptomyces poonensis]
MSAESTGQNEHYLRVFRRRFRDWRGTRPFWAGLFVMFGGIPIVYFPYANLQIGHLTLAMQTQGGAGALIIGVLLITLGFTLWFQRHVRTFAGVAAILLALVSIPVANLGGFVIGFLPALIGGALAVSWAPGVEEQPVAATAPNDDVASETAVAGAANGVSGEFDDLSGTTPKNGTNGRDSAG